MEFLVNGAEIISASCFGFYGITCFTSRKMVEEFDRWLVPQVRILTGVLQVLAAIGIALGHFFSRPILLLSAYGLALMMFFALLARLRIRDRPLNAVPAALLMLLNLFIGLRA